MYTLGGGVDRERGWGRAQESYAVATELAAHQAGSEWFTLGDKDFATHIMRSRLLGLGYPLSEVTTALAVRWGLGVDAGVQLLPMSDDPVETHVVVDDGSGGRRAIHFQEWWVRHHAELPAHSIVAVGAEEARPAPGVLEAIGSCDVVVLPPSNPVVSVGTVLAVPGLREALRATSAPVVGVSPIVNGRPVRGMADACLTAIGVATTAEAVGGLYADLLDGWLVDTSDAHLDGSTVPGGRGRTRAVPLLMSDPEATRQLAAATLELAEEVR
jgi:LPPG:FO 2-phospho-L-lactate transferase